jgi:hypothetical protein
MIKIILNENQYNQLLNVKPQEREFIAYHSTDYQIKDFDFNEVQMKSQSSTRINGIFFSNIPQKSWGDLTYKVKLISKNPCVFDLSKSRFDSLSVQEAFDANYKGMPSYLIEDLLEYNEDYLIDPEDYNDEDEYQMAVENNKENVENLVESWQSSDLLIITNQNYAKHDVEYIAISPDYGVQPCQIVNLGLF